MPVPYRFLLNDLGNDNERISQLKNILALDIGTQFIKLLDVRKSGERSVIKHYAIREITENGMRISDERVTQAIGDMASRMEGSSREVVTSVSGKSVVVRNIDLPNIGQVRVDLVVRNIIPLNRNKAGKMIQRAGCEFKNLDLQTASKLQRFITEKQRVLAARGISL